MRGECLCGQVRFELLGARPRLYQCHCSLCRKQGGALSNCATIVGAQDFRWLSGEEHIGSWVKDSGFRSDFCRCCGSPLPNPLRNSPYFWVPAGLLDDDVPLEIVAQLSLVSKASWDPMTLPGARYADLPDWADLLALLHP